MSSAENAFQAAIFAALAGDAALQELLGPDRIFDHRRAGLAMPYLVIGESETRPIAPDVRELMLTIEAWSDAEGRKEIQTIADRVRTILDDAALAPAGFALVSLAHLAARIRREEKTKAFRADIRFRAAMES
ncbi:MAG: hypothetical protein RLZZ444_3262 [Pseudomonadota bacterium]|jgi:MYXO-CTERM domain-containing protein